LKFYEQANAGLWRRWQKKSVVIDHIISKIAIDGQVLQVLSKKQAGEGVLMKAVKDRINVK